MNRIAFLLGSLNRGGTETLLLDVLRNSQHNGLNAICLYRKSGDLKTDFENCGVKVSNLSVGKNPIFYLQRLRRLLFENKIDCVHAQQPIDAFYAKIACLGTNIKVFLTLHGYDFNNTAVEHYLLSYILKRTDKNVFVSSTLKNYYLQKFNLNPIKQEVIYNGISFDKLNKNVLPGLRNELGSSQLKGELGIDKTTLLLGTVGNFVPGRDQLTICRFLNEFHHQNKDWHFVFVGKRDESYKERYDECLNYCKVNNLGSNVSFLGSRSDVPEILKQLDAFVYSTNHDTFGIAVVEAMVTGIPVFVNSWEVMREITENGKYATLYETGNEKDLLTKFTLFLQNKDFYIQKAKDASGYVNNKFSIEKYISELKAMYSSIL